MDGPSSWAEPSSATSDGIVGNIVPICRGSRGLLLHLSVLQHTFSHHCTILDRGPRHCTTTERTSKTRQIMKGIKNGYGHMALWIQSSEAEEDIVS